MAVRGRPFQKGTSGNPGGRPRVLADVQELARERSPEAINILAQRHARRKGPASRKSSRCKLTVGSWLWEANTADLSDTYKDRPQHYE